MSVKTDLWLIGAGQMAMDYAMVLDSLKIEYDVIGRGKTSAVQFEANCNQKVKVGGVDYWLRQEGIHTPKFAIVAVGIEDLASTTINLLKCGVKNILVEKPAGVNSVEINQLAKETKNKNARVFVAYNRRFYSSTIKAKKIIKNDGGVSSFHFDFTEWLHLVEETKVSIKVKNYWFIANSSHVVDLAFYLCGKPDKISYYTAGSLDWHPAASVFAGAGITKNNVLFTYNANWGAPGRWGVEIMTNKHRLILRPLEKLQIQKHGSIEINYINDIDYSLDEDYKPGLFLQTSNFLNLNNESMIDIKQFNSMIRVYNKMTNYHIKN